MCMVCNEQSMVWDDSQRLTICRLNDAKTGMPTFCIDQKSEDGTQSVAIQVNFCPWCGKFLRGD